MGETGVKQSGFQNSEGVKAPKRQQPFATARFARRKDCCQPAERRKPALRVRASYRTNISTESSIDGRS